MKTLNKEFPFFISKALGEHAIDFAVKSVQPMIKRGWIKRADVHIVVLAPQLVTDANRKYPGKYSLEPELLCEKSFGIKEKWEHPYDEIAQCKALQKWHGRNTNDNEATPAHLLFINDTPFGGAVKMEGLVAGCSGVQQWYDKMMCRLTLAHLIAAARERFEQYRKLYPKFDFIKDIEFSRNA